MPLEWRRGRGRGLAASVSCVRHAKLCSHRVRSIKFVTVKRVNKVSQLIVHCCCSYVCHLVASAGNQYEIYEATRTWTAPRPPTCAVPAVSGSASGLSPLKVKYKYSAQRQIKIIKKYYTLVAFPGPPPAPWSLSPLHFVALKRASKSRDAR